MEYDQRMIIKFLLNERTNVCDSIGRLQAQFDEHVYKLRIIQFWITKAWLGHQDFHDEIEIGRPPLDDLDAKITAILDKFLFKSAPSIVETFRVANSTVLLHLHDVIGFISFYLY
jgi:hypothetical protein